MTTESQLEACASAHEPPLLPLSHFVPDGLTYDEAYARAYPGQAYEHSAVDSFRVAMRHWREAGLICDSGTKRPGVSGRNQTVWVLGDDREKVHAHRLRKLHKLAAFLDYKVVPK